MRRILALPLALLAVAACADQPVEPELEPSFARMSAAKATGGAYAAALDLYLSFTAQGTPGAAKGNVNYRHAATDRHFMGRVTCYYQDGNEAGFSGMVTRANVSGDYFFIEVIDNGQGRKATGPDRFRVRLMNRTPDCTRLSRSYPGVVTDGNIQVH